jgi:hypothetical protein
MVVIIDHHYKATCVGLEVAGFNSGCAIRITTSSQNRFVHLHYAKLGEPHSRVAAGIKKMQ